MTCSFSVPDRLPELRRPVGGRLDLAWATGAGLGVVSVVVAGLVLCSRRTDVPAPSDVPAPWGASVAEGSLAAPVVGDVDLVRAAHTAENAPPVA
jgi:hypothetical protein